MLLGDVVRQRKARKTVAARICIRISGQFPAGIESQNNATGSEERDVLVARPRERPSQPIPVEVDGLVEAADTERHDAYPGLHNYSSR